MHTASKKCIPSSKIDCYKEHIVPGFNEHVKELHDIARHEFVMWRAAGKPRFGEICLSMNQFRLRFKSAKSTASKMKLKCELIRWQG